MKYIRISVIIEIKLYLFNEKGESNILKVFFVFFLNQEFA